MLKNAHIPALIGTFGLPFGDYLQAVRAAGGKLIAYSWDRKQIIGEISPSGLSDGARLAGYSIRARDVTGDIPRNVRQQYLRLVEQRAGKGSYRFMILLPKGLEAEFVGTIKALLAEGNVSFKDVKVVHYEYKRHSGKIYIVIHRVTLSGNSKRLSLSARLLP